MHHPTKEDLQAMARRSVGGALRETMESHLDECDECRIWYIDFCRQQRAGRAEHSDVGHDIQESLRRIEERIHKEVEDGQVDEQTMLGSSLALVRKIDSGGLGDVFLYRDKSLGRDVALKVMKTAVANRPTARARFLREYRITSRLDHPGVVPVYGKGVTEDGRDYYVMRFVDGATLALSVDEFHASRSPLHRTNRSFRKLLESFRTVCATIHHAHSKQVLHRDLKPENIMLEGDHTTVIDWGLARHQEDCADDTSRDLPSQEFVSGIPESSNQNASAAADTDGAKDALTVAGHKLGTPGYMAPEQVHGVPEDVDERTDIYLLGGVLHYILTGQPPHSSLQRYQPGEIDATRLPIETPTRPVPRELVSIVRCALMNAPEDRYSDAAEMESDIDRWLIHDRVMAHRYSAVEWLGRVIRRHTATAIAITTAGILLLAVTLTALVHVTDARDIATAAQKNAEELSEQANSSHSLATEAWEELANEVYRVFRYTPRTSQTRLRLYEAITNGTRRLTENAKEATRGNLTTVVALRRIAELSLNRFLDPEESQQTVERAELLLRELADENRDNPEFLRERVRLRWLTSQIQRRSGNPVEAELLLQACVKDLRSLNRRFPENGQLKHDLSQSLLLVGDSSYDAHQYDAASPFYQEALELAESLYRLNPEYSTYRRDFSVCLDRKAALLRALGKNEDALSLHSQSLKMALAALKEDRTLLTLSDVAKGHQNVARLQRQLKQHDLAELSCREAIEVGAEMLALEPDSPELIRDQATSYSNLGDVLQDLTRTDEARLAYVKDLELTERLAKLAPADVDLQLDLAISLRKLASFSATQNEFAQAIGFASRAVALTVDLQKAHSADELVAASADRSSRLLSRLLQAVSAVQDRQSARGPLATWQGLAQAVAACQAAGDPHEFGQTVCEPLSELLFKQAFAGMQVVFSDSKELSPEELRGPAQLALDLLLTLPSDATEPVARTRQQRIELLKSLLGRLNTDCR